MWWRCADVPYSHPSLGLSVFFISFIRTALVSSPSLTVFFTFLHSYIRPHTQRLCPRARHGRSDQSPLARRGDSRPRPERPPCRVSDSASLYPRSYSSTRATHRTPMRTRCCSRTLAERHWTLRLTCFMSSAVVCIRFCWPCVLRHHPP